MYINVWNCQARMIVNVEHGAVDITHLIPRAEQMMHAAVNKQGAINWSGQYNVSNSIIRAYERNQKKIDTYIEEQANALEQQWIEKEMVKWEWLKNRIWQAIITEYDEPRQMLVSQLKKNRKYQDLFNLAVENRSIILPDEPRIWEEYLDYVASFHPAGPMPESLKEKAKMTRETPRILSGILKPRHIFSGSSREGEAQKEYELSCRNREKWERFFADFPECGYLYENGNWWGISTTEAFDRLRRWGQYLNNIDENREYTVLLEI